MDYSIIATLGPASQSESTWKEMLSAGVTGFRLNTSHLSLSQLLSWLDRLQTFFASLEWKPALILDLQGSKWRLGNFPACDLINGQVLRLICTASSDQPGTLPVPHPDFFHAALLSTGEIILNDAKISLAVVMTGQDWLKAKVIQGGAISANKGITFSSSTYRIESLNLRDQAILAETLSIPFIRYAISYVKDAAEMDHYRALFGRQAALIAKLERKEAIEEAHQVADVADELWLCRGDLGAELGIKAMAESIHRFSRNVYTFQKPVFLAGQVLEHMTDHPTPTRSEISCLYDALAGGYRGVVLSDETAVGRDPVESCRLAALFKT